MADPTMRDLADQLAKLRGTVQEQGATIQHQGAELARYRRRQRHGRAARRGAPLLLAALLVALIPLATFAANPFTDLNPGSPHNANIDAIYNAGITTGCEPGVAYCPNANVTREEMASFLARTAGLGDNPPVANAATLGGYPAPALNRVSFDNAELAGTLPNNAGFYIDAARVAITIPGPAPQVVVVRAQIGAFNQPSGGRVFGFLRSDTGSSGPVAYYPYLTSAPNTGITATMQWAFLAQPGERTYTLRLAADGLAGPLLLNNPALIATAHPFGPNGAPGTAAIDPAP